MVQSQNPFDLISSVMYPAFDAVNEAADVYEMAAGGHNGDPTTHDPAPLDVATRNNSFSNRSTTLSSPPPKPWWDFWH